LEIENHLNKTKLTSFGEGVGAKIIYDLLFGEGGTL